MSMRERRRMRREAGRATLGSVAAAPSFKPVRKKKSKRFPLRRALVASVSLSVLIALLMAAPKAAHASGSVPEIDPGSIAGAMTLLIGGVLALTDRTRRV